MRDPAVFTKARVRVNYKLNISNLLQIPVCVSSFLYFTFNFVFTVYNPFHCYALHYLTTDKTDEAVKYGTEY